jgi:hypothetical protein
MRLVLACSVLLAAGSALAQAPPGHPALPGPLTAAPPGGPVEQLVSSLDLNDLHIVLQRTSLQQVQARLGGGIAQQGEAGVATRSLCYYQAHSASPWVLWLQSSEVYYGDVIHGFRLMRLVPGTQPEAGCSALPQHSDVALAVGLHLGQSASEAIAALGAPANQTPDTLLFLRARLTEMEGVLFTLASRIVIRLNAAQITSIEASQSTSIS